MTNRKCYISISCFLLAAPVKLQPIRNKLLEAATRDLRKRPQLINRNNSILYAQNLSADLRTRRRCEQQSSQEIQVQEKHTSQHEVLSKYPKQAPWFRVTSILVRDFNTSKESVNALPKVVCFHRGTLVSSHKEF